MRRAADLTGPAIRDQLAATSQFAGVTGTISLGPDRNPVGKKLVILEVDGGKLALARTLSPQ